MFISSQPLVALGTTAALAGAVEFQMKKQTSNFSTTKNVSETAQTTSYTTTITYQINKQDSIKRNEMMELMKASYLYIVTLDNNGVYHYHPEMSASIVAETGTNFTDGGKYMVTFTNETSSLPESYTSFTKDIEVITVTKLAGGYININFNEPTIQFAVELSNGQVINSTNGLLLVPYTLPTGEIKIYKPNSLTRFSADGNQFSGTFYSNTVTEFTGLRAGGFSRIDCPKLTKLAVSSCPLLTSVNIPLCTYLYIPATTNLFTTINSSTVGINSSIIKYFNGDDNLSTTSVTLANVIEVSMRNTLATTISSVSPVLRKLDLYGANLYMTRIKSILTNYCG